MTPASTRTFAELLKRSRVAAGLTQEEDDPAKRGALPDQSPVEHT
jgi:hypothetical protein